LKIVNVDKTFVRTCERSNTFTNADERSQKINVNVQNSKLSPLEINFNFLKKSSTPPKFESIYVYHLNAFVKTKIKISLHKLLNLIYYQ